MQENDTDQANANVQEKINLREGVHLLAHKKYVLILAAALLVTNIASNMTTANPFYFEAVVGDLSK